MKNKTLTILWALFVGLFGFSTATVKPAPNGIALPENYKDWRVIGLSHRVDNQTLRVVLGNDIAIQAAREGKTNPCPKGAILGKMVWKDTVHPEWEKAIESGDLVHIEFMIKDPEKYASIGGWGFARWKGKQLEPYGTDASFVQECFGCHLPVKDKDYVFIRPALLP